jgi:hypothetical protein
MDEDTRLTTPVGKADRQPPAKPPRIATGLGDESDDYGKTRSFSCDYLVEFDDVAITYPD